jgi:hypothetical protein
MQVVIANILFGCNLITYYGSCVLWNDKWQISPRIQFVPGKGPMICTCADQNGGCSMQYVHPATNSDNQTMPTAIMVIRLHIQWWPLKQWRLFSATDLVICKKSNVYGGFVGVDNCDALQTWWFDKCNDLSGHNSSLSLYGQPYIHFKLLQIVESKVVPHY